MSTCIHIAKLVNKHFPKLDEAKIVADISRYKKHQKEGLVDWEDERKIFGKMLNYVIRNRHAASI